MRPLEADEARQVADAIARTCSPLAAYGCSVTREHEIGQRPHRAGAPAPRATPSRPRKVRICHNGTSDLTQPWLFCCFENCLASSLLVFGSVVLPGAAHADPVQLSCRYIGQQTTTHLQLECDNRVGYIVNGQQASTYDPSDQGGLTTPHPTWLVFQPAVGSDQPWPLGWWDSQGQQVCAVSEGNHSASITCGDVSGLV